jgi:hypothetical protein
MYGSVQIRVDGHSIGMCKVICAEYILVVAHLLT